MMTIDDHTNAFFVRSLPECFLFYWQRVRLPIRIVWTYWELDEDMRGTPAADRLSLWRSIMTAKQWREDQVCYWPVAIRPQEQRDYDVRVDVLAALIHAFSPAHVLCFGEQCHATVRHYFNRLINRLPGHCRIHYLPGAEDMLPDNREAKARAWLHIKHL